NRVMNGMMTGDYPSDPKERQKWKIQNKQPNSVLINNTWVSYQRFGPIGEMFHIGATIGDVVEHVRSEDDDAMTKATWAAAAGAVHLLDETGLIGLSMIMEAVRDENKGAAFMANQAAARLPFSSFLRQTASGGIPFTGGAMGDPYMRKAKGFLEGIKM